MTFATLPRRRHRALTFGSNAIAHGANAHLRISSTYGSLVLEAASADERDAWMDAVAAAALPRPPYQRRRCPLRRRSRAGAGAPARARARARGAAAEAGGGRRPRRSPRRGAAGGGVGGGGDDGGDALARVKVRREEEVAAELAAEADALVQRAQDGVKARRWSLADIFRSGGASDEAALQRLDEIAGQLEAMGKNARAAVVAVYAVDARRRAPPPAAAMVDALSAAAELLELAGRSEAARPYFEEAAELAAAELGDGRARVVAEANLGAFLLARGEYERAAERCPPPPPPAAAPSATATPTRSPPSRTWARCARPRATRRRRRSSSVRRSLAAPTRSARRTRRRSCARRTSRASAATPRRPGCRARA